MDAEHGTGVNKYSQAPPVAMLSEDGTSGFGKSTNPFMEPGHENSSSKPSQTPVEVDLHGLGEEPTSFMDSFLNDGSSSKSSNTSSEATVNEDDDDLGLGNKSYRSSTSSSSSSSSSFDENFFLMDEGEPQKSNVESLSLLQLEEIRQLAVKDGDTPHEHVSSNPVSPQPTSLPVVPVRKSARDSPPQIQVMERLEVPDPNRIPASVFARTKSTQQVEWSVQSNESLFSIHMGNNSFSRDQMFFMGRSQELGKYEDMFKYPNNATGVVNNVSTPAGSASDSEKSKSRTASDDAAAETMKGVTRATTEDHNKAKPPDEVTRHSTSTSQVSDDSGVSAVSFAFPILTKNGTKGKSSKLMTENEKRQSQPLPRPKSQPQQQPQQQSQSQSQPQPQPQPELQLQSQPQQGQKQQQQPQSRACGAKAIRTTCLSCLCCLYCR